MASKKKKAREDGAIGGDTERTEPTPEPATTTDPAINQLARMFESFMDVQRARDERLEKESSRQAHQFQVLHHQVTHVEVTRERGNAPLRPDLLEEEDSDNIEHYLTTLERLATVFDWPKDDWAINLIPLLSGKAHSALVPMDPESTLDYDFLKEAGLQKYEINSKT